MMLFVAILFTLVNARILLRDDFNGNSLNASLWNSHLDIENKGNVRVEGGRLRISCGSVVYAVQEYNPLECNLFIRGRWKFDSTFRDAFYLYWRLSSAASYFPWDDSSRCQWGAPADSQTLLCLGEKIVLSNRLGSINPYAGIEVEFFFADYGDELFMNVTDIANGDTTSAIASIIPGRALGYQLMFTNLPIFGDRQAPINNSSMDWVEVSTPDLSWSGNITLTRNSGIVTVNFPPIYYDNFGSPIVEIDWGSSTSIATIGGTSPVWIPNNLSRNFTLGTHSITVTLKDRCGYSESSQLSVTVPPDSTTSFITTSPRLTTSFIEMITSEKSTENESSQRTIAITVAISVAAFVLLAVIFLIVIFVAKRASSDHEQVDLPEIMHGLEDAVTDFDDIKFGQVLGKGNFGIVYKGEWQGKTVALKRVLGSVVSLDMIYNFVKEADVMIAIPHHVNVVQFLSITKPPKPIVIVCEFCSGGSLDNYLKQDEKPVPVAILKKLLLGIANGMKHLHHHNFVHRDIATRNILLGDNLEPKISDFGMARELHNNQTHNTTLTGLGPIRWMSPEAIQNRIYSFKSDAWSFGALINEIVTKNFPFPDLQNMDVVFEVTKRARHPEIPFYAPEPVRLVMEECFKQDPTLRPSFDVICEQLQLIQLK